MSFLGKLPPKLRAKHDAKAMRKFEAAQQGEQTGERRKGLSGVFQKALGTTGTNFSNPKMMADMALQARANMPAAGAPLAGAPVMGNPAMGNPAMDGGTPNMDGGDNTNQFKRGGKIKKKPQAAKKMAKGGSVSSASKRGDGIATKGKTKGRFV